MRRQLAFRPRLAEALEPRLALSHHSLGAPAMALVAGAHGGHHVRPAAHPQNHRIHIGRFGAPTIAGPMSLVTSNAPIPVTGSMAGVPNVFLGRSSSTAPMSIRPGSTPVLVVPHQSMPNLALLPRSTAGRTFAIVATPSLSHGGTTTGGTMTNVGMNGGMTNGGMMGGGMTIVGMSTIGTMGGVLSVGGMMY
jgi:hypothetical protein